jgi:lipopolysaccharide assembly protein A
MRTLVLLIKAVFWFAVFLLLLGFAVKNLDGVTVRYFLGLEWHAPLVLVLLTFFAAGVSLGVAPSIAIVVRQRREILGLKRELRGATRSAPASLSAESA